METLTSGIINVHVDPKDKEEATKLTQQLMEEIVKLRDENIKTLK